MSLESFISEGTDEVSGSALSADSRSHSTMSMYHYKSDNPIDAMILKKGLDFHRKSSMLICQKHSLQDRLIKESKVVNMVKDTDDQFSECPLIPNGTWAHIPFHWLSMMTAIIDVINEAIQKNDIEVIFQLQESQNEFYNKMVKGISKKKGDHHHHKRNQTKIEKCVQRITSSESSKSENDESSRSEPIGNEAIHIQRATFRGHWYVPPKSTNMPYVEPIHDTAFQELLDFMMTLPSVPKKSERQYSVGNKTYSEEITESVLNKLPLGVMLPQDPNSESTDFRGLLESNLEYGTLINEKVTIGQNLEDVDNSEFNAKYVKVVKKPYEYLSNWTKFDKVKYKIEQLKKIKEKRYRARKDLFNKRTESIKITFAQRKTSKEESTITEYIDKLNHEEHFKSHLFTTDEKVPKKVVKSLSARRSIDFKIPTSSECMSRFLNSSIPKSFLDSIKPTHLKLSDLEEVLKNPKSDLNLKYCDQNVIRREIVKQSEMFMKRFYEQSVKGAKRYNYLSRRLVSDLADKQKKERTSIRKRTERTVRKRTIKKKMSENINIKEFIFGVTKKRKENSKVIVPSYHKNITLMKTPIIQLHKLVSLRSCLRNKKYIIKQRINNATKGIENSINNMLNIPLGNKSSKMNYMDLFTPKIMNSFQEQNTLPTLNMNTIINNLINSKKTSKLVKRAEKYKLLQI